MKTKFFLALTLIAFCATACKTDQPQDEPLQLDILGTWRSISNNGKQLTTNERTIISYISANKKTMSLARYIAEFDFFTWRNKAMGDYSFDGRNLIQDAADPGTSHICTAQAMSEQTMCVWYNMFVDKRGNQYPMQDVMVYERVPENLGYEELIIGLWEGVSQTGEQTYGDEKHRWEYKSMDRRGYYTYVYYDWDENAKQWVASKQAVSDYNVHGSWLATRWQPQGSADTFYEWWDIDSITDTEMRWSALREKGGKQYTATFTFKRIVE